MAFNKADNWYLAQCGDNPAIYHLICAEDITEAENSLGCLVSHYVVMPLTWLEINKLTGCIISPIDKLDSPAHGVLIFLHDNKYFSINWC